MFVIEGRAWYVYGRLVFCMRRDPCTMGCVCVTVCGVSIPHVLANNAILDGVIMLSQMGTRSDVT